eukprot:49928-Eustigmatos_ZCMA.PRE.1
MTYTTQPGAGIRVMVHGSVNAALRLCVRWWAHKAAIRVTATVCALKIWTRVEHMPYEPRESQPVRHTSVHSSVVQ